MRGTAEHLKRALALCDLENKELDEYEAKFLSDITTKLEKEQPLTNNQYDFLDEIYEREFGT